MNNLDQKIKLALKYAVIDGCIVGNGEPDAWETSFTIDGDDQFYNHLLSICNAAEKTELLLDWVLGSGEESICVKVCEYMTGKHNPLHSIAKDAANRIMEHYQSTVDEALGE